MKFSLIVPIYNEAHQLNDVLERIFAAKYPCEIEYVLIDDQSTDGSWDIVEKYSARENVVALRQPKNMGKGAAIHAGIKLATGQIIGIQDADFEYDPNDLAKLIQPILDNQADVVYGSRFRQTSPQVHRTIHYLINRFLTLMSNMLSGLFLTDMETCYKVFRADIIKSLDLRCRRFGFEPEVTAKIAKLRLRVHEYAVSYFPRNYLQGKKITWKDGIATLWFLIKYNMKPLKHSVSTRIPQKYIPTAPQWL